MAYRGSSEHVEIPDGVKQIGSETFKGHKEILDVAVPASVENAGNSPFTASVISSVPVMVSVSVSSSDTISVELSGSAPS